MIYVLKMDIFYIVLRNIAETKMSVEKGSILSHAPRKSSWISLQMRFRTTELCSTPVKLFDKANSQRKKFQIIGNVPRAVLRTFHTVSHTFFAD